ncbi:hypothetical protein TVNIR_2394 [Thioalkalivibrio nitratireducens DSM 14787]|uniref:Uncharacterized protein n=1 Tax=Thioalkalivibrio nitratireducens (strain DSM 14787 / UNIQEM 213 / ALEN2) TaxID=1255043 RepID=L0DYF1_THIND|nr:hypothetical protein [Thioalkalivibrio nitratireducens]AGA34037.1 hypothetical protein TVNIR_2394 [Thioalkalivibrio nitratireducens DSM 14787]
MPRLNRSLQAYGTPDFEATLKEELAALGPDVLGLQQGLTAGSISLGENLGVMPLRVTDSPAAICVRAGIFFNSILSGCACADDPTPENENAEYCEIDLEIERNTGEVRIAPVTE